MLCIGLGIFTFSRHPRHPANIGFALGMASLAVIEIGNAMILFAGTGSGTAAGGMRIALIGKSWLPAVWLVFSVAFARANHKESFRIWAPALAGVCIAALFFSFNAGSESFIFLPPPEMEQAVFILGPLGRYFFIYLIVGLVLSLVHLENTLRSSGGAKRWQIKYVIFGVGGILAFHIYLASQVLLFSALNVQVIPVMSAVVLISTSVMALFIVRHRLLEVDIFISRYVVYNSVTVLLVGTYLLAVGLVAHGVNYFNIPSGYFLTTLFVFISILVLFITAFNSSLRRRAQLFINRNFYSHKYEFRDKWMESIKRISSEMAVEKIHKTLTEMITNTMAAKFAYIWLHDPVSRNYFSDSPATPTGCRLIVASHPLLKTIKSQMRPFLLKEIRQDSEQEVNVERIDAIAAETGAVLCAPLVAGVEVVGFVLQGEDISGEEYGIDDFRLVNALTTQAAVRIKHIRLAQELIDAEKVDAFSRMSSFIMHDLKNLTNSLSLISQNARDNMDNPEFQRDAMSAINRTISRMKGLIEKLSAVGGGIELERETVDLGKLIHRAIKKTDTAGGKDVVITKEIDSAPSVYVDPDAVEMVLLNLLTNSYDAIRSQGRIHIKVFLDGENVIVEISDTGVGMSREFIENDLFKPFKSTKKKGFGIGLYQCKAVIGAHGGKVDVKSSEEKGTIFTLNLPVNRDGQTG
ncbi:MAG: histidine kinase [bacterium]|nr:MAG: histidine kinase [bacterium]